MEDTFTSVKVSKKFCDALEAAKGQSWDNIYVDLSVYTAGLPSRIGVGSGVRGLGENKCP